MTCDKCGKELIYDNGTLIDDDDCVPFRANDGTFNFNLCKKCVGKLFNTWLKIPLEMKQ